MQGQCHREKGQRAGGVGHLGPEMLMFLRWACSRGVYRFISRNAGACAFLAHTHTPTHTLSITTPHTLSSIFRNPNNPNNLNNPNNPNNKVFSSRASPSPACLLISHLSGTCLFSHDLSNHPCQVIQGLISIYPRGPEGQKRNFPRA
jgi:hypothetical protein